MKGLGALCVALGLLGGAAQAQTWQAETEDDGAFAYGFAGVPNFMGLYCLGPSLKGGGDASSSGYIETRPSAPGQLMLELGLPVESQADLPPVTLEVAGEDFALPLAMFSEMTGMVTQPIDRFDPMIEALQASNTVRVRGDGRLLLSLPLRGSRRSVDEMLAFCDQVSPPEMPDVGAAGDADGEGVPAQTDQVEADPNAALYDDAFFGRRVLEACNGGATTTPDYLLRGDLDGDGLMDFVLDWGGVSCTGADSLPRGAGRCGAALCSVELFFGTGAAPEEVLSIGAAIETAPDGRVVLVTVPHPSSCDAAIGGPCKALTRFDASGRSDIRVVPLE